MIYIAKNQQQLATCLSFTHTQPICTHQLLINVPLVQAVVNKDNLHTSCLSMHVLTKNLHCAYFKDATSLFLHATVLLPKYLAKDRDTLIEQSFICIDQQFNCSVI